MSGKGHIYLEHNLNRIVSQNYKNFEVIISDQSQDNKIKILCKKYKEKINIKYFLNKDGKKQASANTNYAMQKASGDVIKVMFQDDYFFSDYALSIIRDTFNKNKFSWCVSSCQHSNDGTSVFRKLYPEYNNYIQFGRNTISSPSVLTIKRENYISFDEELIYLMDVDLYKRYFDRDGLPYIIDDILVVNRLHAKQVSQMTPKSLIRSELHYIRSKFRNQMKLKSWFIYLKRVFKTYF
jgi:glycosyltransferase involved in cell wall biosynthesis